MQAAAASNGLVITGKRMGESTHTVEDAARACGCTVGRILKSMVFRGARSGDLHLLLVSGAERADMVKTAEAVGEPLERGEADEVRVRAGFAIPFVRFLRLSMRSTAPAAIFSVKAPTRRPVIAIVPRYGSKNTGEFVGVSRTSLLVCANGEA